MNFVDIYFIEYLLRQWCNLELLINDRVILIFKLHILSLISILREILHFHLISLFGSIVPPSGNLCPLMYVSECRLTTSCILAC